MGATFSSIQVRSDSQEAVIESLSGLLKEPTYVSPAVGGWVGVYPEGAEATDALAVGLSLRLATAVLDWSVYDSDVFTYSLYEKGALGAEFNSAPGYFEVMSAEGDEEHGPERVDPARVQGDPQALLPYCVPGTTLVAIQEVLHPAETVRPAIEASASLPGLDKAMEQWARVLNTTPKALRQGVDQKMREKYAFADHQATDLAGLLGLDEDLAQSRYSDIDEGELEEYDKEDFRLLGAEDLSQTYKDGKLWDIGCLQSRDRLRHWLLQGANPNTRDRGGQPVLFRYVVFVEHLKILLAFGADVNLASTQSPYLSPDYPDVAGHHEAGVTVLMVAARLTDGKSGRVESVVRLLLDAGADVHARSETGRTALAEALRMTDPAQHQGRMGRQHTQAALEQAAAASARVVEMLRAAGSAE